MKMDALHDQNTQDIERIQQKIEESKKDIESIQQEIEKTKKGIEVITDDRRDILMHILAAQKETEMLRMSTLACRMRKLATLEFTMATLEFTMASFEEKQRLTTLMECRRNAERFDVFMEERLWMRQCIQPCRYSVASVCYSSQE